MAKLPNKFIWLGAKDDTSTHLVLETGKSYPSSSISTGMLIKWMDEGKLEFIQEDRSDEIPDDVVLKVHDIKRGSTDDLKR